MAYKLRVPARINLLGNPSDANEGDFATISTAIDIYAHAVIEKSETFELEQLLKIENGFDCSNQLSFTADEIPLPYTGELDLIKGGINRLYKFSSEFRRKLGDHGFKISTWTDVPKQSGLGGSSLLVILALGGLREIYALDRLVHNDYVLAELTQRVESKELKITAGYADRYVPIFGGIAYLDYRGKIFQKAIHNEPYTTYERLDYWVEEIPLVCVSSGINRDSGDVHGKMRPLYLNEYEKWLTNGGSPPPMVRFMESALETAWKGKIALLKQDWETFGKLMNKNHESVDKMMTYCGFEDGAGWANNLLIETALNNEAIGAKLTGAGCGGSVFAITKPENIWELVSVWQNKTSELGLHNARVFTPKISFKGMEIFEAT